MPDDGIERWIINGELREASGGGEAVTVRNSLHSFVMAEIVRVLGNWRRTQPPPRGKVYCGEAGIKLQWNPEITVGADVAYASAELLAKQSGSTTLIEGVPELLVEILSPNDTVEQIDEKIDAYLDAGIALVWIIDPRRRTAMIYQPGKQPRLVTENDDLEGGDVLPGFSVRFAELFE
jgi:Uma2 family endonuclease